MEITELERMGYMLCASLMKRDFSSVAQRLGYALHGGRPHAIAIKEDFEQSLAECGAALAQAKINLVIKVFPPGTPSFIHLVECRFLFPNSQAALLAEIIENEAGCYLEQISCVAQ